MIFKKYRATNAREVAQLTETLKQKVQTKAQRIRRYEKRETHYSQNKMFKEDTKKFYRNLGMKNIGGQRTSHYDRSRDLLDVTMGRRSTA
jgi:hypothetical protein